MTKISQLLTILFINLSLSTYFVFSEDTDELHTNQNKEESISNSLLSEAETYYKNGMEIMMQTSGRNKRNLQMAMQTLLEAAFLNHTGALEEVGLAYLFGDGLPLDIAKAKETFLNLNSRGNARGQLGLGFLYSTGLLYNSSQAMTLLHYTFSSLGGDKYARIAMGYRYFAGLNVESDCESALGLYETLAMEVAASVEFTGGPLMQRMRLVEENEHWGVVMGNNQNNNQLIDQELLNYYHLLAGKGDVSAQVALAQLYFQGGRGVTIEHGLAFRFFKMAADNNHPMALSMLGKMYIKGIPNVVEASNLTAIEYFIKGMKLNSPIAMTGLGYMHLHGYGVKVDYASALRYFTMSADQGYVDGQLYVALMHFNGTGVTTDYKTALKYFNLASQHGHILAFYYLARMNANGIGVVRSCNLAAELYKNVVERGKWGTYLMEAYMDYKSGRIDEALVKYLFLAEMGYEVAQSNAAFILEKGDISIIPQTEHLTRALLLWQRSANQGNAISRVKVGDYYFYGHGHEVNYNLASQQYLIAADQQNIAQAIFNVGYMHEQGLGLKQDIHLAKRFYDLAAETSSDAYFPVKIAMMKLFFHLSLEYFTDYSKLFELLQSFHVYLSNSYFNFYVMPFLFGILFLIIVRLKMNRVINIH